MSRYEEGLALVEEKVGNGKDNVIALATIARDLSPEGNPRPFVREVDAYYEDGVFYVTTWAESTKIKQVEKNPEVAFSVHDEWFSGNGIGENLGWVMDAKNAELRTKLRTAFAAWYDFANNESDENCCILAIRITRATINHNHGAEFFHMDFINKVCSEEGRFL